MENFFQQFVSGQYSFLLKLSIPNEILALLVTILIITIICICFFVKDNFKRIKYSSLSISIHYSIFLLCHTLIFRNIKPIPEIKLIPFWSYIDIIKNDQYVFLYENILNILLFVPLGFFLSAYLGRNKYWKLVGIGVCISLFIEISQYVFQRGLCEFDDLFHNTLGCLIGCCLYIWIEHFIHIHQNMKVEEIN